MTDAEQLKQQAAASERREKEEAELYRENGSKMYSDAAHADLMNSITVRRDETIAGLVEQAEEGVSEAQAHLDAVENRDPLDRLSEDELQRAGSRRAFVKEDAEELPLTELAGRIKAAVREGDKTMLTLYSRYASRRVASEHERFHESGGSSSPAEAQAFRELREALETLDQKLNSGGHAFALQKAREKLEAAAKAEMHVRGRAYTHEEKLAMSYSPF